MKRTDLNYAARQVIFWGLFLAAILAATLASADPFDRTDQTRSYFDHNGNFAGSSNTHGNDNTTSGYDRNGHFSGSAIRNSDGTTSLYDGRGHFTGSVTNTSPQQQRGR
jgi:hypothetical protein